MNDNRKLIYDYALEPELAAECDGFLYNQLNTTFGWDNGCLVVKYPTTWKEQVQRLLGNDVRKLELLLDLLKKKSVFKNGPYKKNLAWLENAKNSSFHAILARDSMWRSVILDQPPPSITITRTADSMAKGIEPMLRYAKRIRFIDPYFCALHDRFKEPLRKFLDIIFDNHNVERLELHAWDERKVNWDDFLGECNELSCFIRKDLRLTVHLWKEKTQGQRFHNRFILTDIGGVMFGTGLDQNVVKNDKDEDIITRLSSIDTLRWIAKYSTERHPLEKGKDNTKGPSFELKGKDDIIGCGDG